MTPAADMPGFSVEVFAGPGAHWTIVAAAGEIDIATVGELADVVRRELQDAPVVLDLGEVTFMDSTGIRALDEMLKEASRESRELMLGATMRDNVRQVLEVTGMLKFLPIVGGELGGG
jgi:anti-anti-sigma factor